MADIRLIDGKVVFKDGKASCACCGTEYVIIKYDWAGTGMRDLDSNTTAFGESVGYSCGYSGNYVKFVGGDATGINGFERVDVFVDRAKADGLWTSSYNIDCFAGWFTGAGGSGPANLEVEYKGIKRNKSITPGRQNNCASTSVATVTVYSTKQQDGSYFKIL